MFVVFIKQFYESYEIYLKGKKSLELKISIIT